MFRNTRPLSSLTQTTSNKTFNKALKLIKTQFDAQETNSPPLLFLDFLVSPKGCEMSPTGAHGFLLCSDARELLLTFKTATTVDNPMQVYRTEEPLGMTG